jgi:hypothetical protein
MRNYIVVGAILTVAGAASGCGGDPWAAPGEVPAEPPAAQPVAGSSQLQAVLPRVLDLFAEPLKPMSDVPMPSLAAEGSIELWVSRTGWEEYGQISARRFGSNVTLPVGTTILRAVREPETQRIVKYTAMMKRERGYDPPADMWFAVYDANGDLVRTPEGKELRGKLPTCVICHLARANDGYVFGRTDSR